MTSKFSLPAKVAVSAVTLWLLQGVNGSSLHAQTPTPAASASPSPAPTPRKPAGWVRFWNMVPSNHSALELVFASDPSRVVASSTGMNMVANYNELPPGRYALQVFQVGDRRTPLKNLDVPLRDGTYVTIVAHESGEAVATPVPSVATMPAMPTTTTVPGASPAAVPATPSVSIVIDLVDDTPDPDKPENRLTIRQYSPGARVIVATASKQTTDVLSYSGSQTLTGLPSGVVPLVARASTKTGARTWNTEADFTNCERATLLLIDDAYGRFRPRVTQDGPPRPTPTPKSKS